MHKEVLFAIIFGSLLGLVVAFGVWKANVAIKNTNTFETPQEEKKVQTQEPKEESGLTILKPKDKSVSSLTEIEISGIANPNAIVVLVGEEDEAFIVTADSGEFAGKIELVGGVNLIDVFAINKDGTQKKESLTVAYSSEFAKTTESESTTSADLSKAVEERIKEATDSAQLYLGTVTDITETTLQIRDPQGDIKQVSLSPKETTYVNTIKTAKEVLFKDVAIGDFVAALGNVNGKEVLSARRVIITNAISDSGRIALHGKVTSIARREIDIKTTSKGDEWAIDVPASISVFTASSSATPATSQYTKIKEAMTVVVTADKDEDEVTARSLLILP